MNGCQKFKYVYQAVMSWHIFGDKYNEFDFSILKKPWLDKCIVINSQGL